MMTPATLLRDAAVAGLALTAAGYTVDPAFAGSVAAGALGALLNLWMLSRVVRAATAGAAIFAGRLALKQFVGLAILGGLVARLPVVPVLIGFCSVLLSLAVRAVVGLFQSPPSVGHLPLEQG